MYEFLGSSIDQRDDHVRGFEVQLQVTRRHSVYLHLVQHLQGREQRKGISRKHNGASIRYQRACRPLSTRRQPVIKGRSHPQVDLLMGQFSMQQSSPDGSYLLRGKFAKRDGFSSGKNFVSFWPKSVAERVDFFSATADVGLYLVSWH